MGHYLLPYLLMMAHFISGAFWLILINRKLKPDEARNQWTKYAVFLLLVNLLWSCMLWLGRIFPYLGWIIILGALIEWWHAVKKLKNRIWLLLAFLAFSGGFVGFLYLDQKILLYTYFVVVLFDGSSQVSGQLLGTKLLLPKISPRKTLEGLAGGVFITLATTAFARKSFRFEWDELIFTTCLIISAAFAGDLLASAVKRQAKVSDFGKVLPGHGGIIDRFDSLILAGSIMYLLTRFELWRQ